MQRADKTILVIGATGRQGGAAARHLLADGWRVRAFTRDPDKPSAKALAGAGMGVVKGDLDDRASLERAMSGAYGAFCALTPFERGPEEEVRQGRTVGDVAKAAGIQQFVYSSVGGADRNTGIPHFESKWQIEQYLRGLGLPLAIIRPVYFMDNFDAPGARQAIQGGVLRMAMRPDRPLQMIAVEDIGAFAALAFERPGDFLGRAVEIAGDELTLPQAAEVFGRVMGRPVRYVEQPIAEVRAASADLAAMFQWFNDRGYEADIPALRAIYPPLLTLEAWARRSGWAQIGSGGKAAA